MTRNKVFRLSLALVIGAAVLPAFADDACVDFKWDVRKERALFAETPAVLTAGHDGTSAPLVVPNRLYSLKLVGQDEVAFAVTPGAKMRTPPVFGGLAKLQISTPGTYRVSVDLPFWIDVVSLGALVPAADFQGQHSCNAPHKIVEFDLAGIQPFVLQFSNASTDSILLTITPAPPRKL